MPRTRRAIAAAALTATVVAAASGCGLGPNDPDTGLPKEWNVTGPEISDVLVGNNVWNLPDAEMWEVTGGAELRLLRIGGIAYDFQPLPKNLLRIWLENIRAIGAEPLVQVSRHDTPEEAADLVRELSVDAEEPVMYWSIGNEPSCGYATAAEAPEVADYVKPIAAAMREANPDIVIYAPDGCGFTPDFYEALLSGNGDAADISGMIPGTDQYYIDGLTWHAYVGYGYPNTPVDRLTREGAAYFAADIEGVAELVAHANEASGRTGDDALTWGLAEFNNWGGDPVCSFENGQMIALTYGNLMKHEGDFGLLWSIKENSGTCAGADHGFLGAGNEPRSSYHHMRLVSQYFSGWYVDVDNSSPDVRAFASADAGESRITVILINDSETDYECTLDMAGEAAAGGGCALTSDLGAPISAQVEVAADTTYVLVFDLDGELTSTVSYSAGMDAPSDR